MPWQRRINAEGKRSFISALSSQVDIFKTPLTNEYTEAEPAILYQLYAGKDFRYQCMCTPCCQTIDKSIPQILQRGTTLHSVPAWSDTKVFSRSWWLSLEVLAMYKPGGVAKKTSWGWEGSWTLPTAFSVLSDSSSAEPPYPSPPTPHPHVSVNRAATSDNKTAWRT